MGQGWRSLSRRQSTRGAPLRPDGSGEPSGGGREGAERILDLDAAEAELDGGERSRRRRAFPSRGHGRVWSLAFDIGTLVGLIEVWYVRLLPSFAPLSILALVISMRM
jgi:hypothetical protein